MKAFAGKTQHYQEGMDLRDYFAAKAMEGLIIKSINDGGLTWERIAKSAYIIANEMMQAREQNG